MLARTLTPETEELHPQPPHLAKQQNRKDAKTQPSILKHSLMPELLVRFSQPHSTKDKAKESQDQTQPL